MISFKTTLCAATFLLSFSDSRAFERDNTQTGRTVALEFFYTQDGTTFEEYLVRERIIDKDVSYAADGYVSYVLKLLRYRSGEEQIFFRGPSAPSPEPLSAAKPQVAGMQFLEAKDKIEILIGTTFFTYERYQKEKGVWRFCGQLVFNDRNSFSGSTLNPFNPGRPFWAKAAKLTDWGTIDLTIEDGSKLTLSITDKGEIMTDGKPYVFENPESLTPGMRVSGFTSRADFDKAQFLNTSRDYEEPRDRNGVALSFSNAIKERLQAATDQGSASPVSPMVSDVTSPGAPAAAPARSTQPNAANHLASGTSPAGRIAALIAMLAAAAGLLWLALRNRSRS